MRDEAAPAQEAKTEAVPPQVRSARSIAVFLAQFAALLTMLALPWRGLDTAYAQGCSAAAHVLIGAWVPEATLEPAGRNGPPGTTGWYTTLDVRNEATGQGTRVPFNLRYSYLPLAVFVALAVAAPIHGWKRNLAVVGGGFAVMVFVALGLAVLPMFYVLARTGAIDVGKAARSIIELHFDALVTPTMMYAIPFLVWWLLMALTRPRASSLPDART